MMEVNIKLKRNNFTVDIKQSFCDGITGIYGPSGSGKSSLLSAISGLEIPQEGSISIQDKVLFSAIDKINVPVQKRRIGYVFQEGRLFPHMTVEDNLRYGQRPDGQLQFEEVVDLLNLTHLLKSKPSNISGGERQRTALGRSLLSSPSLLLLDEPFSALDTNIRDQILPFILRIHQRVKIPILVVSHDIADLLKLTSRLFIIKEGRCIGHDDYLTLLKRSDLKDVFGTSSVLNSVAMQVTKVDKGTRLTKLAVTKGDHVVKVVCEKSRTSYEKGQTLKLFIRAEDIALSSFPLEEITIQNQLKGVIVDLIMHDHAVLCMVDVGFILVVEITAESLKRMEIKQDSIVYCLFKSVAIDVAG